MFFCTKCGANLPAQGQSCRHCGASAYSAVVTSPIPSRPAVRRVSPTVASSPTPRTVVVVSQKNSGLAAVLSFFWCGLGQIYLGQILRGVAMMILFPALIWIGGANFVFGVVIAAGSSKPDAAATGGVAALFGLSCLIAGLAIWAFSMVSAYRTAERLNREQLQDARW